MLARLKQTAITSTCIIVTMATGCVTTAIATAVGDIITTVENKHKLYFLDENKHITKEVICFLIYMRQLLRDLQTHIIIDIA